MGNRALRKQAAQLIKERGLPSKLYLNKKPARRLLRAHNLRTIIHKLSFKLGDVVEDCDGLNHVIVDYAYRDRDGDLAFKIGLGSWHGKRIQGYVFEVPQYVFEDGRFSCGCSAGPGPAVTRERIEKWMVSSEKFIEAQRKLGWWTEKHDKRRAHILAGGHVVDERGILLPEWRNDG